VAFFINYRAGGGAMSQELKQNAAPAAPASSWKPYPAYKDSGVEWLGKVPEHWEIIRLKHLASNDINVVQTGPFGAQLHASDYVENGVPLILIRNVNNLKIDDSDIPKISEEKAESLSSYRLEIGDIVFSRVGSIGRIAIVTEREKGWLISGQMLRIRIANPNLKNDFALYVFSSEVISEFVSYKSVGSTRDSINTEILRNVPVVIPPIPEQLFIARYLDDRTRKIDSLIEKKQKLIELLKEERAAVINEAVTKGLDPRAPMKDSEVEWLGEVPEKWEVKRLKYVAEIKSSNVDKKSYDNEIKVFLCNYIDVYKNEFIDNSFSFMEATANENEIAKFNVKKRDVLVTKDSETPDDIANPAYIKEDLINTICGYHLAQIRANQIELIGEYLFRLFQSKKFNSYFEISANGVTRFGLSIDSFKNVLITLPLIEEQTQIVKYIETLTKKIYQTITKIEKEIGLLQEYRTALISEVVTGKIDVRGE